MDKEFIIEFWHKSQEKPETYDQVSVKKGSISLNDQNDLETVDQILQKNGYNTWYKENNQSKTNENDLFSNLRPYKMTDEQKQDYVKGIAESIHNWVIDADEEPDVQKSYCEDFNLNLNKVLDYDWKYIENQLLKQKWTCSLSDWCDFPFTIKINDVDIDDFGGSWWEHPNKHDKEMIEGMGLNYEKYKTHIENWATKQNQEFQQQTKDKGRGR